MNLKGDVISWYESVDILPPVIVTAPVDSLTIAAGGTATHVRHGHQPRPSGVDLSVAAQWQRHRRSDQCHLCHLQRQFRRTSGSTGSKSAIRKRPSLSGQNDTPTVVLVTATGVFTIEAEDFNYESGKAKPEASVMPYMGDAYNGLSAVFDVDYHNTGATTSADGWTPIYRMGEPITSGTEAEMGANKTVNGAMTRAGAWDMTQNYKIGWIGTGDWGNYTRTFPAGTYDVFAAQSYDGISASQLNWQHRVCHGREHHDSDGRANRYRSMPPGTGAWSRNNLVRMTDNAGNAEDRHLQGGETDHPLDV